MRRQAELVERELVGDLARRLEERVRDDAFTADLYRGLANRAWRKEGVEGEAALSWRRAEELVNELRSLASLPRLELAQTGGEGEVSKTLAGELGRLGWASRPLDTGGHEAAHLDDEESPPPASRRAG